MNEELFLDISLILSAYVRISAKRIVSGDISSFELYDMEVGSDRIKALVDPAEITFLQTARLSVDEIRYYSLGTEFPFEEFFLELDNRIQHRLFMETIFKEIAQEVSLRMHMDTYQLIQGQVSEAQKIQIRLILTQLNTYADEDIERFLVELKKRKDNQ